MDKFLRTPTFRGVQTAKIFFELNAPETYEILNLEDRHRGREIFSKIQCALHEGGGQADRPGGETQR